MSVIAHSKKIGISVLLFIMGAIFGPLIFAAVMTAISVNREETYIYTASEADLFIENYRDNLSANRLFLTMMPPPDGKECGYEPLMLFPRAWHEMIEGQQEGKFSDYAGYYVLDQWRNDTKDQ